MDEQGLLSKIFTIEYLTVILILVTGFYAWVTFRILKANESVVKVMRDEIEVLNRPYINVSLNLKSGRPIFYLKIANCGKTAARNLRLSLDKPFYQYNERKEEANLQNFNLFSQQIESMAPDEQIELSLIQSFVVFGNSGVSEPLPLKFNITAEYHYSDRKFKETHCIDFSPYLQTAIPQDPIATNLEQIKKALEDIKKGISEASKKMKS